MDSRKIKKNVTIDIDKYANVETGEMLLAEGVSVISREDTGLVLLSSDEYAIWDCGRWRRLFEELSDVDVGRLSKMTLMTKTSLNMLFQGNNEPHNPKTLQVVLGMRSNRTFISFIKRLEDLRVVYVWRGSEIGQGRNVYLLNPLLSRRRKTISDWVLKIFRKFDNK